MSARQRLSFSDIVEKQPTRIALIFNFLAILEMLAMGDLNIQMGEGFNNFWIVKNDLVYN